MVDNCLLIQGSSDSRWARFFGVGEYQFWVMNFFFHK